MGLDAEQLYSVLHNLFSQWGLFYNLKINPSENVKGDSYCYLRFYSARAASMASMARRDNRGKMVLEEGKVQIKLASHVTSGASMQLPLAKHKCKELANYYLGFNG